MIDLDVIPPHTPLPWLISLTGHAHEKTIGSQLANKQPYSQ